MLAMEKGLGQGTGENERDPVACRCAVTNMKMGLVCMNFRFADG